MLVKNTIVSLSNTKKIAAKHKLNCCYDYFMTTVATLPPNIGH